MHAQYMQTAPKEVRVSKFIRQFHRWTSLAFMLAVVAILAMLGLGQQPAQWLYYLPLAPLFFLFITGAWMFFQPYAAKARRAKAT
jgi:ABC-type polysaccharide/polyol phosphate export permease